MQICRDLWLILHLVFSIQEIIRIKAEHPDDSQAVFNDRVKGQLKVTRAFGAGFLKKVGWWCNFDLFFPFFLQGTWTVCTFLLWLAEMVFVTYIHARTSVQSDCPHAFMVGINFCFYIFFPKIVVRKCFLE